MAGLLADLVVYEGPPNPADLMTIETYLASRVPDTLGTNDCGPAVIHSDGLAGKIEVCGSANVAAGAFYLRAYDLPTARFSFFLVSANQGFASPPVSSGNIRLGSNIGRYNQPG